MDDSSIDEMATGIPSLETRAKPFVKAFIIGCFVYAGVLLAGLAFLLWLGGRTEP